MYGLTPSYFTTLFPPKHYEIHQYLTRHGHYYSDIKFHRHNYCNLNSFLPYRTRLWNNLPFYIQQTPPYLILNAFFTSNTLPAPNLFYNGFRKCQLLHARLRLECSSLKAHIYSKYRQQSRLHLWWNRKNSTYFLHYHNITSILILV